MWCLHGNWGHQMMDDKVMLIVGKKEEGVLKLPASSNRYKMEASNFNGSGTERRWTPETVFPTTSTLYRQTSSESGVRHISFSMQFGCAPSWPLQSYFCKTCPGDGSNTEWEQKPWTQTLRRWAKGTWSERWPIKLTLDLGRLLKDLWRSPSTPFSSPAQCTVTGSQASV